MAKVSCCMLKLIFLFNDDADGDNDNEYASDNTGYQQFHLILCSVSWSDAMATAHTADK